MPTNYKFQYEQMKKMVTMYQDEIVPGLWQKIKELERQSTKVETNFYDQEETFTNCTVQVLTNTKTGETSVGWWRNEHDPDDFLGEYEEENE